MPVSQRLFACGEFLQFDAECVSNSSDENSDKNANNHSLQNQHGGMIDHIFEGHN